MASSSFNRDQLEADPSTLVIPGNNIPNLLLALESYVFHYLAAANASQTSLPIWRQRDAFVAATAHSLLSTGHTATKRDLYYMAKALFGRQANADAAVQRVADALPCMRNDLNIVAASKSLVAGKLSFVSEDGYTLHVNLFGASGMLIPARPERFQSLETEAEFVLVVEKETVFTTLAATYAFFAESKCILITGKGYPDSAARLLLAQINSTHPTLPILFLMDADPHGLHIAMTYFHALPNKAAYRYAGVRPSEKEGILSDLPDSVLLNVTEREIVLATNIIQTTSLPHGTSGNGNECPQEELVGEMEYVLKSGVKFEIEALAALSNQQNLADGHHAIGLPSNPLIGYIRHKISVLAPGATYG